MSVNTTTTTQHSVKKNTSDGSPYALYTHLNEYEAIWGEAPLMLVRALHCATVLLEQNNQLNEADTRDYIDKAQKNIIFSESARAFTRDAQQVKTLMQWSVLDESERIKIGADIANLRQENQYGLEDTLFASVHLIAESWFAVVHDILRLPFESMSTRKIAERIKLCARIIDTQREFVRILEYMSHHDYHELRVALRDASGAQSQRIYKVPMLARAVFERYWAYLKTAGISPLHVLDNQEKYAGHYGLLSAFQDLTRAFQSFLFGHYLMVSKILGSSSLGSLGGQVNGLAGHAIHSLFPELDQLFFDYTQITNFRHGHKSGNVVMEKELHWKVADYSPYNVVHPLHEDKVKQVVDRYFACIQQRDIEGWVKQFHPTAGQMCDAPGSRPYKGHSKLFIFMKNFFKAFHSVSPQVISLQIKDNIARCQWQMQANTYHNTLICFSGIETFWLNAEYQIMYALADYDAEALAHDLLHDFARIDYVKPDRFEMYH
jgi:tryptophan 2,3-dioxygenase